MARLYYLRGESRGRLVSPGESRPHHRVRHGDVPMTWPAGV